MGDELRRAEPIGYIGVNQQWGRSMFVGLAAAFAVLALGLLVGAAVARSTTVLGFAAGSAFGIVVMWTLIERVSERTLVYPYELVLHNRRGAFATILRGSISSFRIEEGGEDAPHIVAFEIGGKRSKIVGSDRQHGPILRDIFQPRRTAEETKAKLDEWLRHGRYR